MSLLGEKNGQYPNGVPCATRTLDHAGSTDFDGGKARFDGTLGGAEDDAEKSMMGGCYQVHFRVWSVINTSMTLSGPTERPIGWRDYDVARSGGMGPQGHLRRLDERQLRLAVLHHEHGQEQLGPRQLS